MDGQSDSSQLNDVPEFLNELIPYRCPKCGNARRFATLRELRHHLQRDHSFKMGCVRPHPRASIFNSPRSQQSQNQDGEQRYHDVRGDFRQSEKFKINQENYNTRDEREASPLLQTFKEETSALEMAVQRAKQLELSHKATSLHNLSNTSINTDFRSSLKDIPSNTGLKPNMAKPVAMDTTMASWNLPTTIHNAPIPSAMDPTTPSTTTPYLQSGFVHSIPSALPVKRQSDNLTSEIMKSRFQHWATADALYETQDLLKQMENEAEDKCRQQRVLIEQLVHDMRRKDDELQTSTVEHTRLREERERLLSETEQLTKQADEYNSNIRHELLNRDKALANVNKELERLRELSEKEIKAKNNDVMKAREHVRRLEWERDSLVAETEKLLQQADSDRNNLTQMVKQKEAELHNVNETLKQLQSNQEAMLEKTMSVYRNAEESRQAMRAAIDTKEGQLNHAMQQIDAMQTLHHRLVEQSQVLTDQADENTASMQRLLKIKVEQIHDLAKQLETLKAEKQRLEENSQSLAERAESTSSVVDSLKETVKEKENELKVTQVELHNLKTYLKNTADKERTARNKLESFIEDLIGRAEKAEEELRMLKSKSSSSMMTGAESTSFPISHNLLEASERQTLPTKVAPVKPPRTRSRAEKDNAPAWRGNVGSILTFEPIEPDAAAPDPLFYATEVLNVSNRIVKPRHASGDYENVSNVHRKESPPNKAPSFTSPKQKRKPNLAQTTSRRRYSQKHESDYETDTTTEPLDETTDKVSPSRVRPKTRKRSRRSSRGSVKQSPRAKSYDDQRLLRRSEEKKQFIEHSDLNEPNSDIISDSEYYIAKYNTHKAHSSRAQKHSAQSRESGDRKMSKTKFDHDKHIPQTDENEEGDADSEISLPRNTSPSQKASHVVPEERRPTSVGHSVSTESDKLSTVKRDDSQQYASLLDKISTNDNIDTSQDYQATKKNAAEQPKPSINNTTMKNDKGKENKKSNQPQIDKNKTQVQDNTVSENLDAPPTDDLDELMDENGILWDDMDTLPDVSDAELDRVSPSGSEAIATKNTTVTVIKQPVLSPLAQTHSKTIQESKDILEQIKDLRYPDSDHSGVDNNLPKADIQKSKSIASRTLTQDTMTLSAQPRTVIVHAVSQSDLKMTDIVKKKETGSIFRPIKSSNENGSSTSEKDVTSGGREVHNYMKASAQIDMYGSDGDYNNDSYSSLSDGSKASLYMPKEYRLKSKTDEESVQEKIKRISAKYSTKRDPGKDPSIESKIKSINDKYTAKRDHILEGHGVKRIGNGTGTYMTGYPSYLTEARSRPASLSPNRPLTGIASPRYLASRISPRNELHDRFVINGRFRYAGQPTTNGSMIQNTIQPLPELKTTEQAGYRPFDIQSSLDPRHKLVEQLPTKISDNPLHTQRTTLPPSSWETFDDSQPSSAQLENKTVVINGNQQDKIETNAKSLGAENNVPFRSACSKERRGILQEVVLPNNVVDILASAPESSIPEMKSFEYMTDTPDVLNVTKKDDLQHIRDGSTKNDLVESLNDISDDDSTETNKGYQKLDEEMNDYLDNTDSCETYENSFERKLGERLDLNLRTESIDSDKNIAHEQETGVTSVTMPQIPDKVMETVTSTSKSVEYVPESHLSLFEDVEQSCDSYTLSKPLSAFAAEIDDYSMGYVTNSQSYIDLPGDNDSIVDTDLDTDTVAVKGAFYRDTKKIKDMLSDMSNRPEVQERQIFKQTHKTTSSTSSQASFEILERIPAVVREASRRRRAALVRIFSYLDITSLCMASQVCREWRLVCRSPNLWKVVKVENVRVTQTFLTYLSKKCSKLKVLVLKDLRPIQRFDLNDFDQVNIIRGGLESGFEMITKKAEATLHTIAIINCGQLFSAKCLWTASCSCRMLRHVTYISNHDVIGSEVMWALGSGCRDLKTLRVHPIHPNPRCEQFTTRCAQMVGQCFQDLTDLSIGCKHIDLSCLPFIAKRCQKLERLELHDMKFVTCELMDTCCTNGLKSLQSLHLLATPIAPGCIHLLYDTCCHLRTVEVQLSQSDHVIDEENSMSIPEYTELVEGYEELLKQKDFADILLLDVAKPQPKETLEPIEEKSFFQKWFG